MNKLSTKEGKQQLILTYLPFMLNGVLALSIGSLLPFIRDSRGLDYVFAGLLVSLHSVGNFISSFFAGTVAMALGRKRSILIFNSLYALSYVLIISTNNNAGLVIAFLMTGLARGASSNFGNTVINNLAPGNAAILNGLHASFSVGALAFPIILTTMTRNSSDNWIMAVYMMVVMGIISFIMYFANPVPNDLGVKKKDASQKSAKADYNFFREPLFYLVTLTLFFYLCTEQGVIGWLITYFSDTGYLNPNVAQLTSSVMWLMMLIGRLATAYGSSKLRKENMLLGMSCGVAASFLWLLFARNTVTIMIGIVGFGLSMAGIYATTVSFAGNLIQKYSLCWSFILTLASFGSILMPSIIGAIAENAGIAAGISSIMVVVALDFALIVTLRKYLRSGKAV